MFLTMAVLLAHTACFWLIFKLPIDNMLKASAKRHTERCTAASPALPA